MAPAATTIGMIEAAGVDTLVGAQRETGLRRSARSARRMSMPFNVTPASARLFHAWRP